MSATPAVPGSEDGLSPGQPPAAGCCSRPSSVRVASIDATVVGIALPAIGRDFHASLAALQWVVTAYTLTLAGLLLFAGALGDKYGRKRVFLIGVSGSRSRPLLCAVAPNAAC